MNDAVRGEHMGDSPDRLCGLLALWGDPQAEKLAGFFAEGAVWVDGPNGVHHGAAVVDELTRQLSIFRGQWTAVDTLVADCTPNGHPDAPYWHVGRIERVPGCGLPSGGRLTR